MRIASLSLLIATSLFTSGVLAQDTTTVNRIESEISAKQNEYTSSTSLLEKHIKEEGQLQAQLELLRSRAIELNKERNEALEAMNDTYRRLIDDPTLDISTVQSRYQKAVVDSNRNKDDIAMQLAAIASKRTAIEQTRISKHALSNLLLGLKDQLTVARVERLYNEFTREGSLEVNSLINCKRTETLASCEQRGQQLALQKATQRFVNEIFENLTERQLVEPKRNMAGAQVQVLSSHVISSAFSGQGNYTVNLSATMRGDVNSSRLCNLLNVDTKFCAKYGTPSAGGYQPVYDANFSDSQLIFSNDSDNAAIAAITNPVQRASASQPVQKKPTKVADDKNKLIPLTLRSNVHGDEVFINGVSVGSTRLVTRLPKGLHTIEIRKPGYKPYKARLDLTQARTLFAKLVKNSESAVATPKKTTPIAANDCPKGMDISENEKESEKAAEQDKASEAEQALEKAAEQDKVSEAEQAFQTESEIALDTSFAIIPKGSFKMGDLTGNGLDNERPVTEKLISKPFLMQVNEVTVAEFDAFVTSTAYKTDAENAKGCAYYLNGEPVWDANLNWRDHGFEQANDSPVVCLSYNDTQAYADWFSELKGQKFRLPSEVEWEYAARAGTETEYPWGNEIGKNLANCGWCGSQWSNKSTAPVASFAANAFGLYDTVGNAWEWTEKTAKDAGVAVRGGAWNFAPSLARSSTRLILAPDFRANYIGFRLMSEQ